MAQGRPTRDQGGNHERARGIVNVSSVHEMIPKPRFIGYAASKEGMQNLDGGLTLYPDFRTAWSSE